MPVLCPDVLELILKRLPIETRVALRVLPNRVSAPAELTKTVARMARIAAHPNNLCFVLARVKGHDKPIKVISYREMELDMDTGVWTPFYNYITSCRTLHLNVNELVFSPFLYWHDFVPSSQPVYQWEIEHLEKCEKLGDVC